MESKPIILIHPFARKMRNGKENPKNYPYWIDLINLMIDKYHIIQLGIDGEEQLVYDFRKNLKLKEIEGLIDECSTWIAIDSFFQHLAWLKGKKGIVIFGKSDPNIFGHKENINLLKDRKNLRDKQWWLWEQTEFNKNDFIEPKIIIDSIIQII